MDFFYGDQLRWTFGFENPNKAAALIASLLPLIWLLAALASRIKSRWLRWPLLTLTCGALIVGWYCLFKTYSRGGIAAAAAAFLYIGWLNRKAWLRQWFSVSLIAVVIAALFFSTKVADRSAEWVVHQDQSVGNRYTLWRGGLQMLASFPNGVGRGNSGNFYMQWFQPVDATEGYRTLVNSYLTFATEQGIWIFGIALFGVSLFWLLSRPGIEDSSMTTMSVGFRAALIALFVGGFFSTTLETFRVWIPGLVAACGLLAVSGIYWRKKNVRRALKNASFIAIGVCGALWVCGYLLRGDLAVSGNQKLISVSPRHAHARESLSVLVDQKVLGNDFGKLLRKLVVKTGEPVRAVIQEGGNTKIGAKRMLVAGDQVASMPTGKIERLILLAPAILDEANALKILHSAQQIEILLPGIDEDGRCAFWQTMAEKAGLKTDVQILNGVGVRIDWDWAQVIEAVKG